MIFCRFFYLNKTYSVRILQISINFSNKNILLKDEHIFNVMYHYILIAGAYDWAKQTLKAHEKDKREYVYSREKLEQGKTHDHLWNAAQVRICNISLLSFCSGCNIW
jgi:deoxyribodipyrimidine photolyase